MKHSFELLQALFTRVLHDLSGSVGAVTNCAGLLDNHNEAIVSQAKDMLQLESNKLFNEIRFIKFIMEMNNELDKDINLVQKCFSKLLANDISKLQLIIDKKVIKIPTLVLQAVFAILRLELDSEHFKKHKNFVVEIFNKRILIKVNNPPLSEQNNIIRLFLSTNLQKMTIQNSYAHYIMTLFNEAGYSMNIMHDESMHEYIITKKLTDDEI